MAARQQLGFPVYNPQLGKDGYGYLVPPLNPAALVDGAEDQSAQPSRGGFGEGAGSLLSAIGLALMSSPRNAPLSNLAIILPGVMQAQQSRVKQQQVFDLVKGLGNNGPPMPGMEDAAPGAALPLAQGTPGAAGMAANPVPVSPVADIASPAQYAPLIQQAAANNGIDPQTLTKLIATESNFNPNAKSPAGAGGIAQFMPATAQRFGIDPYKPEQAIPAAAQYVAQNKEMFGDNLGLALAGYNWGEGNVRKWLIGGASPDRMPLETRNYVQKITGQPIEGWLNGGGAAASAGQAQPVQMAQADQVVASNAAPGPREIAQARAAMPRTPPPTSPDAVSGARTQQVTAQRYFDHWSRVMGAASMLGQEGKGLMEAAKLRAEFALKFMTPTEQQRNAEALAKATGISVGQAFDRIMPNHTPEHAGAVKAAEAQATLGPELYKAEQLKRLEAIYGPQIAGLVKQAEENAALKTLPQRKAIDVAGNIQEAKGKGTPDITEFEYSQQNQGFPGFQRQQKQAGRPLNLGSIPQDYQLVTGDDGSFRMQLVPGSPTDLAQQNRAVGAQRSQNIVLQEIDRILPKVSIMTTGPLGALTQNMPGMPAHDMQQLILPIRSNVGLDAINNMRQQSPTGGALGNVTEGEHKIVQSVLGSLEQSQTPGQFRDNLVRLRTIYTDFVNGTPGQLNALLRAGKITQQQHDTAIAERNSVMNVAFPGAIDAVSRESQPSGGAPQGGGAPPGASQIGTYKGKPVYQMPDGSRKVMQ